MIQHIATAGGNAAPKIKNFHFFVKSPAGRLPWPISKIFRGFYLKKTTRWFKKWLTLFICNSDVVDQRGYSTTNKVSKITKVHDSVIQSAWRYIIVHMQTLSNCSMLTALKFAWMNTAMLQTSIPLPPYPHFSTLCLAPVYADNPQWMVP